MSRMTRVPPFFPASSAYGFPLHVFHIRLSLIFVMRHYFHLCVRRGGWGGELEGRRGSVLEDLLFCHLTSFWNSHLLMGTHNCMTSREINFLVRQPDTLRPQEKKKKREQSELSSKGGKDKGNCMAQLPSSHWRNILLPSLGNPKMSVSY